MKSVSYPDCRISFPTLPFARDAYSAKGQSEHRLLAAVHFGIAGGCKKIKEKLSHIKSNCCDG